MVEITPMLPSPLCRLLDEELNIVIEELNIVKLGLDIFRKIWYNIVQTVRNSLKSIELT